MNGVWEKPVLTSRPFCFHTQWPHMQPQPARNVDRVQVRLAAGWAGSHSLHSTSFTTFLFPQFRRRRGLLSFFSSSNVEQEAAAALVPNLAVPPSCQIQTRIHHTAPDSRRDSAGAPIRLEINERMHPVRG